MEEEATTKPTRNPPGPVFFMGAMALYLFLVHGVSLWSADLGPTVPAMAQHPELPPYTQATLQAVATATGQSQAVHGLMALTLLYATMVTLFFLTRALAHGPVWLGSLAGSAFMAHPVKTEVFFETIGLYYLLSVLLALLAVLTYIRNIEQPSVTRYLLSLATFAAAAVPFTINASLFVVLFLLEFYPARQETRRWERLFPFVAVAAVANWFHMDTIYNALASPSEMLGPVLVLLYPIGLLPETVATLEASPWLAWFWGTLAFLLAAAVFDVVRNGAFRVGLLAILLFRFFPGAEPFNYTTLDGGAQLLFPLALGCIALAGLSRWLMRHEAWGRPTVALTTMLCVVLFILQFQANRAWAARDGVGNKATTTVAQLAGSATEGANHDE